VKLLAAISLLGLVTADLARAHDPYEITSVAYVHSNRIEMFIEMEFPAGMRLSGQKPVNDLAILSQFETALPRLRELAGNFYRFTAGNNAVAVLSTNVELGVEDHIRFRVEYAATPHRPLRFTARGLGGISDENPYGTSLTVLDMVNQKVLGQTTLFPATPDAQFPPATETDLVDTPTNAPTPTATISDTETPTPPPIANQTRREIPIEPKTNPNLAVLMTLLICGAILGIVLLRRRK